jgi:tetratricopeptide (TPR) repeat protein
LAGTLVLVFAFLAASFPVRNADFWLHLAGGRLLAGGQYPFGVDPFSYTTAGTYWANQAWLFDLAVYGVYTLAGGAALVVLKALVVTALAGLMLLVRRRGGPGWVPAFCTALALLAMSPRLLLQPACLSCFFLGLTLWLLWRVQPDEPAGEAAATGWQVGRCLPLVLVFALWANVDEWFWLGPLLAALFWVGGWLRGGPRLPAWVVPAGLAACLLNPYGYRAFTLPAELSPVLWDGGVMQDLRFRRLFASPWQFDIFLSSAAGVSQAAWAYFVLVGLGLVSFALRWRDLSGWRLPVWLVFGLLGAWQVRTLPFFAVVAGPVTALNLQDALAVWSPGRERRRSWAAGAAYGILVAALLALIGLAWEGSLQGWRLESRRAAWAVQPDPSLQRVAQTLRQWRQQGKLREADRVFAFHPDVVPYCAWFCWPEEVKGFFDHRLTLFGRTARVYEEVCRDLNPIVGPPGENGWRKVFREQGISYLVLYDRDPQLLLTGGLPGWVLLRVDGAALIYGWKQGNEPERPMPERFDAERLAFGPEGEASPLPPAPGRGPGRGAHPEPWISPPQSRPLPAWESSAATVYLGLYSESAPVHHAAGKAQGLGTLAAGMLGVAAAPAGIPATAAGIVLRHPQSRTFPLFVGGAAERPPALPLLAVRAARRALADNPEDANAYLRLAQAYRVLRDDTGETRLPPLAMLRHVQMVTALEQALVLNPDLVEAHEALIDLYAERQYLDVALEHLRALLAILRRAKPLSGQAGESQSHGLAQLEGQVVDLETLVRERQNTYAVRAASLHDNPLQRAQLALALGLPRTALDDVLLKSRVLLFGTGGARLELELLLTLGRLDQVRDMLDDEEMRQARKTLGSFDLQEVDPAGRRILYSIPAYDWLLGCQAAAGGDYDRADSVLAEVSRAKHSEARDNLRVLRRNLPHTLLTELGARAHQGAVVFPPLAGKNRERMTEALAHTFRLQAEAADLEVVAGILALERGLPSAARPHLEQALEISAPGNIRGGHSAGRPLALAYLQRLAVGAKADR